MVRILITNTYTIYNKGDAAIIIGTLKTIRKFYREADISILGYTPDKDRKYYSKYSAKTYDRLFSTVGKNRSWLFITSLVFFFKMILFLIWTKLDFIPIPKKDKIILELYRNADIIISCGGAYLGGKKYASLVTSLFPIYLAKNLKKKVYFYANSIDPFLSNFVKHLTKFVLNRVDLITLREPHSLEVLKSIKIRRPTHLTADPAFLIDEGPLEEGKFLLRKAGVVNASGLRIGMTVRRWNFPNSIDPKEKYENYLREISSFIERMVEGKEATVILFPQVIVAPNDDDRIISNEIKTRLKQRVCERVFVLNGDYTPEQIKTMIGTTDVFVGTRMHSNIFAISMHVPTLAIAYEIKTNGIMKMVGLEDYVVDISTLTADQIVDRINELLKNGEKIKTLIKEKLPVIKTLALQNGEFLKLLMESNRTI